MAVVKKEKSGIKHILRILLLTTVLVVFSYNEELLLSSDVQTGVPEVSLKANGGGTSFFPKML